MLVVVLNDGETYTAIDGCVILDIPENVEEYDVDTYVAENYGSGTPISEPRIMNVIQLDAYEIKSIVNGLSGPDITDLSIAYDPIDRAIKFKINRGIWSPPFGKEI